MLTMLLATILIEYGVLLMFGERSRRVLLSSVVVNVLTNVPLNYVFLSLPGPIGIKELLVAEALIIIIEALWYYVVCRLPVGRASVYSALCNAISFLTGVIVQSLLLLFEIPIIY